MAWELTYCTQTYAFGQTEGNTHLSALTLILATGVSFMVVGRLTRAPASAHQSCTLGLVRAWLGSSGVVRFISQALLQRCKYLCAHRNRERGEGPT